MRPGESSRVAHSCHKGDEKGFPGGGRDSRMRVLHCMVPSRVFEWRRALRSFHVAGIALRIAKSQVKAPINLTSRVVPCYETSRRFSWAFMCFLQSDAVLYFSLPRVFHVPLWQKRGFCLSLQTDCGCKKIKFRKSYRREEAAHGEARCDAAGPFARGAF